MAAIILFNYASRSRPENFFRGLNSIIDNLSNKEDYFITCTFDLNDESMYNDSVITRLNTYKKVAYYFGVSYNKVDAINKNIDKFPSFDVVVNFSDDMIFATPGFDDIIRNDFKEAGGLDWFIHYPDGKVQERLSTMSLMGYEYFKRFNYIYHPDFKEVYCDDFAMGQAKYFGRYKYVNKDLFRHLHPAWGLAPTDDLYKRWENPEAYAIDKTTYDKLKVELK